MSEVFWSIVFLSCLYGGFWADFAIMHTMWLWFIPPYSIGFLIFMIFLIAMVDNMEFPALPFILTYLGACHFYGSFSVVNFILTQPWDSALYFLGYLVIGAVWTLPRLKLFLREKKNMDRLRRELESQGVISSPAPTRRSTRAQEQAAASTEAPPSEQEIENRELAIASKFLSENKMRIYTWIVYWPFSMLHALTHNLVEELLNYFYGRLKKIYLSMIRNAMEMIKKGGKDD